MIRQLIKSVASSPASMGAISVARGSRVCALTYHRVNAGPGIFAGIDVGRFHAQMRWLKQHCRLLHPDELDTALTGRRQRRPQVLVTFDDGYRDFYDVAFPILQELAIPSLMFLPTALIGGGELLWTDMLKVAAAMSECSTARLPLTPDVSMALDTPAARRRYVQEANRQLKGQSDAERRGLLNGLLHELGVEQPNTRVGRQMLTWAEVRETMALVTFGGHSHEHPILASLPAAAQRADLATSTAILARELGAPARYFAYPNGTRRDFTDETKAILREMGYRFAFTTIGGLNKSSSDRLSLLRQPTECNSMSDLAWLVMGG